MANICSNCEYAKERRGLICQSCIDGKNFKRSSIQELNKVYQYELDRNFDLVEIELDVIYQDNEYITIRIDSYFVKTIFRNELCSFKNGYLSQYKLNDERKKAVYKELLHLKLHNQHIVLDELKEEYRKRAKQIKKRIKNIKLKCVDFEIVS